MTWGCPDEDDDWSDDPPEPQYPDLTLEVDGPEILGVLLGVDGEVAYTLIDRPWIPPEQWGFAGGASRFRHTDLSE